MEEKSVDGTFASGVECFQNPNGIDFKGAGTAGTLELELAEDLHRLHELLVLIEDEATL